MTELRKELIEKYTWLIEQELIGNIELNTWEEGFLESIADQLEAEDGFLTDLQIEKLEQIHYKYNK